MGVKIAAIILFIVCICAYIFYSFSNKNKIDTVTRLYTNFKKEYGTELYTAMAYHIGGMLEKDCTIFVAADGNGKIYDAVLIEKDENDFSEKTRPATEFMNINILEYLQTEQEKKDNPMTRYDETILRKDGKEKAFYQAAVSIKGQIDKEKGKED